MSASPPCAKETSAFASLPQLPDAFNPAISAPAGSRPNKLTPKLKPNSADIAQWKKTDNSNKSPTANNFTTTSNNGRQPTVLTCKALAAKKTLPPSFPFSYLISPEGADSIINLNYLTEARASGLCAIGLAHYEHGLTPPAQMPKETSQPADEAFSTIWTKWELFSTSLTSQTKDSKKASNASTAPFGPAIPTAAPSHPTNANAVIGIVLNARMLLPRLDSEQILLNNTSPPSKPSPTTSESAAIWTAALEPNNAPPIWTPLKNSKPSPLPPSPTRLLQL